MTHSIPIPTPLHEPTNLSVADGIADLYTQRRFSLRL